MVNEKEKLKNNINEESIPNEIIKNVTKNVENEKGQDHKAEVNLFFSFDIVNSTKYKSITTYWPKIMKCLLKYIKDMVFSEIESSDLSLWRVIGDEIVFVLKIRSIDEMREAVDNIFYITQLISAKLKNGSFQERLENQSIVKNELEIIKIQNNLSIKSAAWIAAVNEEINSPYDNIIDYYESGWNKRQIIDYIGKDIDTGFRIKSETFSRKLIISIEIAYFLSKKYLNDLEKNKSYNKIVDKRYYDNIVIMDYKKLKGVWGEGLYPLIFYHNKCKTVDVNNESENISFDDSFEYDEPENIEIVRRYFLRKKIKDIKENKENFLMDDMYKPEIAIDKIIKSKYLYKKLEYIKGICPLEGVDITNNGVKERKDENPIELHCAVVCCDVENKRILSMKRSESHLTKPGKWDFGCSKAESNKEIEDSIKDQYKSNFGIEIELYKNNKRSEKNVNPLFVYEFEKENSGIIKGLIFVAKISNENKENISEDFKGNYKYKKLIWIKENELDNFVIDEKDNLVTDFENTARYVFDNMENWFGKE